MRFISTLILVCICGGALADATKLAKLHEDIEQDYLAVTHIDADGISEIPSSALVLFDVREIDEFKVSHLPGAIRIDPGITAEAFEAQYGASLKGKTAVFYCSVGRRSSSLAQRVISAEAAPDTAIIYNLIGGIFLWRNEERALVDDNGVTDAVHPYNRFWGRLIEDKQAIRMR